MDEVTTAAAEFDADPGIGAIILTGNEKAFAAGADIKEMADLSFADVFAADFFAPWAKFAATRTPTIAAVAGLRARRRLRTGDDVRHPDRRRHRQVRSARDQARRAAGHGRLAAADPRHRQGQGHGPDPDRPHHRRRGGRAQRPGLAGGARRHPARRGEGRRRPPSPGMSLSAARMAKEAVNRAFEIDARPRDCSTSAGCSTRPSPPTTRPRAWRRSPRSAHRTSPTVNLRGVTDTRHRHGIPRTRNEPSAGHRNPTPRGGTHAAKAPGGFGTTRSSAPPSGWCSSGCR